MRLYNWLDLFAARLRSVFLRRRSRPRRRWSRLPARPAAPLSFERLEDRVLLSAPRPHGAILGDPVYFNPVTMMNEPGFDGSPDTLGYAFHGFGAGQRVGHSVTNLGDVNGDGYEDFGIGANGANRAFVVFGDPTNLANFDVADGTTDGIIDLNLIGLGFGYVFTSTNGVVNEQVGVQISGGGDFNGDGTPDILVTLPGSDATSPPNAANANRGRAFVAFGGAGNLNFLDGKGSPAGDREIDLFQFNQATGTANETQDGWGNRIVRIDGFQNNARAGVSARFIGDVNGDGFDDIAIGSPNWDADTNSSAGNQRGEAYVVFGRTSSTNNQNGWFDNAVVDLNALGSNGFRITGSNDWASGARGQAGFAVSGLGDINGDGIADFAVTVIGEDTTDGDSGATYVLFGAESLPGGSITLAGANFTGANGFVVHGIGPSDLSGTSVSGAGDVNGDGYDDFIIGATGAQSDGITTGQAYVIFGRPTWTNRLDLVDLTGVNGFMINGIALGDNVGIAAAGGGDVNGDGFDDIIVAAHMADANGSNSGSVYVIYGRSTGFDKHFRLIDLNGTNGFTLHGLAANHQAGFAVSIAGDVNGDGFADLLIGAPNAAVGAYAAAGRAYLLYGGDFGTNPNYNPPPAVQVGGPGGVTLNSPPGPGWDVLIGGTGDDTLQSQGGPDVLIGGRGDDTFIITDAFFSPVANSGTRRIQGGTGSNTLVFLADGATLDLTAIPDNRIQDVNVIDIRGVVHPESYSTGDNTLIITPRELFNISRYQAVIDPSSPLNSHSELWVRRDAGDVVVATGFSYTGDSRQFGGVTFQVWMSPVNAKGGRAVLYIEDPAVITPTQLNGTNGAQLPGQAGDAAGVSVSGIGDVNGDGYDDFLIGAYNASPNGAQSGRAYVVFGRADWTPTAGSFALTGPNLDGTNGFIINGLAGGDFLGKSVSAAGDVNGDGFADFLIGAHGADPNGKESAGEVYLIFGGDNIGAGGTFNLTTLNGTNGYRIRGMDVNDFLGWSVSTAGDVNGDGYADILLGAWQGDPGAAPGVDTVRGETYVLFGGPTGLAALDAFDGASNGQINLTLGMFNAGSGLLDGTHGFRIDGVSDGDHSGRAVSSAGDLNGDGFDDLVIGAPNAVRSDNGQRTGEIYVVFGRTNWTAPGVLTPVGAAESATAVSFKLNSLNGTNGFRLRGIDLYDNAGVSVSSAGDVNGDGFADLLIGAHRAEAAAGGTTDTGEAYVVFGKASGFSAVFDLSTLATGNGVNGFVIRGMTSTHPDSFLGYSVSGIGDFNGDGFDDLLIGSPRSSPLGMTRGGRAYVLFGKADWTGTSLLVPDTKTATGLNIGLAGFRIDGTSGSPFNRDYLGISVSGAGDVNGDGFADLLVGAYRANGGTGAAYIIFGGPETFLGTSRPQYIGAGTNPVADAALRAGNNTNADFFAPPIGPGNRDIFVGFQGHDDFTSLGGPDVFRGGQGNDFFRIPDVNFSGNRNIDGGTGVDMLVLTGGGQTLDLTAIPNTQIKNIEIIDIRGSGANQLILNQREVLNLSTGGRDANLGQFSGDSLANVLTVLRNRDDAVQMGPGWVKAPNAAYLTITTDNAGGTYKAFFEMYTSGSATLLLETQSVILNGTTIEIYGTAQDDHFTWDAVTHILTITTAGVAVSYDLDDLGVYGVDWTNLVIDGLGGNDSVSYTGTTGDDRVEVGTASINFEYDGSHAGFEVTTVNVERFAGLNGAGGTDTVRLMGAGQSLNLTGPLGAALTSVELVDITGTGNNSFVLDFAAVQANGVVPLTVLRNLGDTVSFDVGWTLGPSAFWDAGRSSFFEVYTNGAETVRVQDVLFTQTGSTGAFIGTSGDDVFGYNAATHVVSVNGVAYDLTLPGGVSLVTLDGLAGNDSLNLVGTSGDDLVVRTPTSIQFEFNAGHAGFELTTTSIERLASFDGQGHVAGDEIRLPGSGQTLDLTGAGGTTLMNVELIDVRGAGGNTLTLDFAAAVTNVSTPLTVLRDPDDTVNIGSGWTLTTATWDAGRQTYFENYTQGGQTLRLQTGTVVVSGSQANVFGTSQNDLFIYDAVTQVMLINGVAYDLSAPGGVNKIQVDGQAGVDEIRVLGTAGADVMQLTTATTTHYEYNPGVPGFDLTAINVEQRSLDGRGGNDTIVLPGANQVLDLTTAPGSLNKNIEFINITGSGDNALILNPTAAVNNVSTPLTVNRNNGDVVNIGAGWTLAPLAFFDGAKFYEVFTAGGQTLRVESLQVAVSGDTANVKGTGGNDNFVYDAQTNVVTVNGVSYQLPVGATRVNLDGLAGNDTLTLLGTPGNDRVVLHPGAALMDFNPGQAGFDFVANSVEVVSVNGRGEAGGAGDSVTMYDSAGDDQLTVNLTAATMTGPGLNYSVTGFEQIVAASIRGGHDRGTLFDSAGNDVFSASPTVANLTGPGYVNQVSGFRQVTGRAPNGGFDRGFLTDSAGSDTFNANAAAGVASMTGAGFLNTAIGFEVVSGQAVFPNGGHDTAFLNDSPGNDKFVSRMNVSFLDGGGFLHEAVNFEVVSARATAGGFDQAFLHDSPGDDTFTGSSLSASIVPNSVLPGPGQYREAVGFDVVAAWSTLGGRDRATLFDTPGNDVVSIRPTAANFSANGNLYLQALGFTFVTARSNSGGTDFAFLFDSAGDDAFVGRPGTATLFAQGPVPAFVSEAIGFAAVSARASTGNDLATLFDSSGDDVFTANARTGLATMRGTGFFNETVGFRQVFAYGSQGTDRSNLTDSAGVDTFFGRGADGRLSGPGFAYVASGFDFVSIFSPDGPANLLDIANLGYVFNRLGTWNPV